MDDPAVHLATFARARSDERQFLAEPAGPTPGEPASWTLGVLAACLSAIAGAAVVSIWMAFAPPKAFGSTSIAISAAVLLAIVGVVAVNRRARMALRHFAALAFATLWSFAVVGWLFVFPGIGWVGGVLVFGAGAVGTLVALLLVFGARFSRWRFDTLAGSLVAVTTIAMVVVTWSPLIDLGLRVRLSLVQDRYEQAIEANEVEETGGFVEGGLSGWVWIDQMIFSDPAAGVVFDSSDRLEDRTHPEPIGVRALGEWMSCERIKRYWYWCRFG